MASRKNYEKTIYSYADLEIKNSNIVIARESIKVSTSGFVGLVSHSERNDKTIISLTLIRITQNNDAFDVEIKTNKEPINIRTKTDSFDVKNLVVKKADDLPTSLKKYGISPAMLQKLASVSKKNPETYLTDKDSDTKPKPKPKPKSKTDTLALKNKK